MSTGLSCASATIKYLLFSFNFFLAIYGLLLVVVGTMLLNAPAPLSQIVDHLNPLAIVLFAAGFMIFVTVFCGCCGAVRESHRLLDTFTVLLLVIAFVQVVAFVMAFASSCEHRDRLEKTLQDLFPWVRDGDDLFGLAVKEVDRLQEQFKCCGVSGPLWWQRPVLPASCCADRIKNCLVVDAYPNGCEGIIIQFFTNGDKILGGVATSFTLVKLLGAWFVLRLAGAIKRTEWLVLSDPSDTTGDLATSTDFKTKES